MVTIEEIQERIVELEMIKAKPKLKYRYETSDEYLDDLIETNFIMLRLLQGKSH